MRVALLLFLLISLALRHRRRQRRPPPLPFLADPPLSCEVLVLITSPLPLVPAPLLVLLSPPPSPVPRGCRPATYPAAPLSCHPLYFLLVVLSFFFFDFSGTSWSPALCREVASRLLTTPQGIPQVAGACVISWLEKPFRLECERPITPPPRSQDFQHRECSQPSPNAGPSVLRELHLGPASLLARLGAPI